MKINEVIIRPIVTEKATQMVAKNIYTFMVHSAANKNQLKNVLEKLYKVKVGVVRITNRQGKMKRIGRTMRTVQQPSKKIAYVTLTEGKIDLFPQA